MRVLVTGACGFVGQHLVAEMSGSYSLLSVDTHKQNLVGTAVTQIDILDKGFIQIGLDFKPEVVIHLAGLQFSKPIVRWKREAYFAGNVEMAKSLGQLIETCASIQHVVFISTDMVYGFPEGEQVATTMQPRPIGPYGRSKLASELLLKASADMRGIPLTVFRPRLINGPGRAGTIATLAKFIRAGLPIPIIGSGNTKYQMVSVVDVVSAIVASVQKRKGGLFNLGSAHSPTVNQLLEATIKSVGSRSRLLHLPRIPTLILLRMLDRIGLSPLSEEQFEIACVNYELDVSDTGDSLNWKSTESDFEIMNTALIALEGGRMDLDFAGKISLDVLVVDLDGTLIKNDLLREGLARLAVANPFSFVRAIFIFLTKGKASLKWFVANQVQIKPDLLPIRKSVLEIIQWHRSKDFSETWLATGSPSIYALQIAEHLGIFDRTLASSETENLTGTRKLTEVQRLLPTGASFSYIGNGRVDYPLLQKADAGYLVSGKQKRPTALIGVSLELLVEKRSTHKIFIRHIRLHQWAKNFLVFVPLLTAHRLFSGQDWLLSIIAFLSFSTAASAIYGLNDLFDLWTDRSGNLTKRSRAMASGNLDASVGLVISMALGVVSLFVGFSIGRDFGLVVLSYLIMTSLYSFKLKRIVLLDVLVLSLLYIVRIIAGAVALKLDLSFWILSFSTFLFFSLALLKRFSELLEATNVQIAKSSVISGRGYRKVDLEMVRTLGAAAGVLSVLVYALYINDPGIRLLYANAAVLWFGLPILTIWVSWLWLKAGRGEMHSDPIFFALKDRASLLCGVLLATTFVIAAL